MKVNGWKFEERLTPIGSDELLELTWPFYSHALRSFGASRCMFESHSRSVCEVGNSHQ